VIEFFATLSWLAVGQIILIDLLLGGDNAIVIALACRNLPDALRLRGILWGTVGAIVARIILLAFASTVLQLSFVKLVGGLLLYWIAIKLLLDTEDEHDDIHASDRLLTAIKTIIVADLVMSIDNVIAVAGAAQHAGGDNQLILMIFGILVSVPIIVWGSTFVLRLINSFPIIVVAGSAMLGYIAGAMACADPVVLKVIKSQFAYLDATIFLLNVKLSVPGLICALSTIIFAAFQWHLSKKISKTSQ
jgi:YjbE family integral membrane protein